jgi:hypothetical protein
MFAQKGKKGNKSADKKWANNALQIEHGFYSFFIRTTNSF